MIQLLTEPSGAQPVFREVVLTCLGGWGDAAPSHPVPVGAPVEMLCLPTAAGGGWIVFQSLLQARLWVLMGQEDLLRRSRLGLLLVEILKTRS